MKFRIRISLVNGITSESVQKFLECYFAYVLVYHEFPERDDKNSHIHAYVDDTMSLSIDAIRKRVKRAFNIQKTSDYSIKHCEDGRVDEFIQYLFNTKHGNAATLVGTHNFDLERLRKLQVQAQDITDDYASRQESKSKSREPKGPTQWQLAVEVREYLEAKHVVLENASVEELTLAAVTVHRRHKKAFCKFSLARIILTVMDDARIVKQMQEYFRAL